MPRGARPDLTEPPLLIDAGVDPETTEEDGVKIPFDDPDFNDPDLIDPPLIGDPDFIVPGVLIELDPTVGVTGVVVLFGVETLLVILTSFEIVDFIEKSESYGTIEPDLDKGV